MATPFAPPPPEAQSTGGGGISPLALLALPAGFALGTVNPQAGRSAINLGFLFNQFQEAERRRDEGGQREAMREFSRETTGKNRVIAILSRIPTAEGIESQRQFAINAGLTNEEVDALKAALSGQQLSISDVTQPGPEGRGLVPIPAVGGLEEAGIIPQFQRETVTPQIFGPPTPIFEQDPRRVTELPAAERDVALRREVERRQAGQAPRGVSEITPPRVTGFEALPQPSSFETIVPGQTISAPTRETIRTALTTEAQEFPRQRGRLELLKERSKERAERTKGAEAFKEKLKKLDINSRQSIVQFQVAARKELQSRLFLQQDETQVASDEARLERLRESLQQRTGTAIVLETMKQNGRAALATSLQAEQLGIGFAEDILASFARTSPTVIVPQLIEALSDPSIQTSRDALNAIKGALEGVASSISKLTAREQGELIIAQQPTDSARAAVLAAVASERQAKGDVGGAAVLSKMAEMMASGRGQEININLAQDPTFNREHNETILAGHESLDLVSELRGNIQRGGKAGIVGGLQRVRNFAIGLGMDISSDESISAQFENPENKVNLFRIREGFNPETEQLRVTANLLKYSNARLLNRSGRISDRDFQNAPPFIGLSITTPQFAQGLIATESFIRRKIRSSADALSEGGVDVTPEPQQMSNVIATVVSRFPELRGAQLDLAIERAYRTVGIVATTKAVRDAKRLILKRLGTGRAKP